MISIYNFVLCFFAVIFSPIIAVAFLVQPKFRAGFFQKMGFLKQFKKNNEKTTIHFHAVSVGEVNAVENLIKTTRKKYPDYEIVLTTTTKTGQEVANKKLKDVADKILYFPFDFTFSVKSFLNTIKPDKSIIAETELWPNFSKQAKLFGVELYVINGRISPNSFKGYKKIKFFIKNIFNNYTKILMQSNSDAERILELGAEKDKVKVMGNLKFDIEPNLTEDEISKLKNDLKIGETPLFIVASTHANEEEIVLKVLKEVKKEVPNLKTLIAPRHPQRFSTVEDEIKLFGFTYGKRSENATFEDNEIIMLDTMGELSKMYALGYVAFIGGSFSNTGGHNPLEANIWGVPAISGPIVFNFKDIYKLLTQKEAAFIVNDGNEFQKLLLKFLQDKVFHQNTTKNAKRIFEESSGAIEKAICEIF